MRYLLPAAASFAILVGVAVGPPFGGGAATRDEPPLAEAPPLPGAGADIIQGQVVVRFEPGVPDWAAAAVVGAYGGAIEEQHARSGLRTVEAPSGVDAAVMAAQLQRSPFVAEANVSYRVRAFPAPNDTNYSFQWHMHNTTGGLRAEAAWDGAPNRGAGVVVAVIDSGVAYEDFTGPGGLGSQTFERAPDLASTTFASPWDFANNDAHANDDNGHGTHVAGTIAQNTNNGYGVAGVAGNATIMPVKVLGWDGSGQDADLVEALYYAVDHGADVINMSLGFTGTGEPDGSGNVCTEVVGLTAALDYAEAHGVVVVAAAGNEGGVITCPAAYEPVVAVGATRYDGQVTAYSNRGPALDVTAPGGDTTLDQNHDGWSDGVLQETYCDAYWVLMIVGRYDTFCDVFYQGTSMAAPHVTGTAALLLGESPSATPAQVRSILTSTARDRGAAGYDTLYGWGAVDAEAAVAALGGLPATSTPTPASTSTPDDTPTATATPPPTATFTATATNTATATDTATATPTSTPTPAATPTPTATFTATATYTPPATSTPTATPAPLIALHIGDLDGAVSGRSSWRARVYAEVHTSAHALVSGALVTFSYSGGVSGQASCVTNSKGRCYILTSHVTASATSITATVTNVSKDGYNYAPGTNHDPNGDSDGTTITVTKP